MSHGFRDMLVTKRKAEKQGYAFRGTIEEGEVEICCRRENMIYDDFLRAKATTEYLYRHPQLFNVVGKD